MKNKQNMKRLHRKHTKDLKEKRRKDDEFFSMLCNGETAIFFITLDDGKGNRIVMTMEDMEAFLDMEGCDV